MAPTPNIRTSRAEHSATDLALTLDTFGSGCSVSPTTSSSTNHDMAPMTASALGSYDYSGSNVAHCYLDLQFHSNALGYVNPGGTDKTCWIIPHCYPSAEFAASEDFSNISLSNQQTRGSIPALQPYYQGMVNPLNIKTYVASELSAPLEVYVSTNF
jgi:hypothetical protein